MIRSGTRSLGLVAAVAILCACAGARAPTATPAASTLRAVEVAHAHERARDHDRARTAHLAAISEARDTASRAYARRAWIDTLLSWRQLPEAHAALTQLAAELGDARAYHDLGVVGTLIDAPGATAALRQAVALAPDDPRPRIALAAQLWRQGARGEARATYQALLHLELPPAVRRKVEWAVATLADAP